MTRKKVTVTVLLPITVVYGEPIQGVDLSRHALQLAQGYDYIGGVGFGDIGSYSWRAGKPRKDDRE